MCYTKTDLNPWKLLQTELCKAEMRQRIHHWEKLLDVFQMSVDD